MRYNNFVACHYYDKKYFVSTSGDNWRYCKAYISQCLGEYETKKVEEEKNKWGELTKMCQQINHGKQQQRLCGYKKELLDSNPDPMLEYYVVNIVANG